MEKEILLTNNKSKTNGNKENIIFFHLEKNGRLLPYDSIESNTNLLDVYNYERNSSNKIRLTKKTVYSKVDGNFKASLKTKGILSREDMLSS